MISARPELAKMEPYVPGMSLGQARANSGRDQVVKLASNESLWGPSPLALQAAHRAVDQIQYYPVVQESELVQQLAVASSLEPAHIVVGNGADEILRLAAEAFVGPGDEVLFPHPSFPSYIHCALLAGGHPVPVPLLPTGANDLEAILARISPATRLIYLCSPNNPTGVPVDPVVFESFLNRLPDRVLVVVDSAYYEFCQVPQPDIAAFIREGRPLLWVRTFSKLYALAALRIGWGAAAPELTTQLFKVRDPFSVNGVGWSAALASLQDRPYFDAVLVESVAARRYLTQALNRLGYECFTSQTNFVTFGVNGDAAQLAQQLLSQGFVVRSTQSFGLDGHIRVTVAPQTVLEDFVSALSGLSR